MIYSLLSDVGNHTVPIAALSHSIHIDTITMTNNPNPISPLLTDSQRMHCHAVHIIIASLPCHPQLDRRVVLMTGITSV
jgi:hypothetical protein